jgi:hypothetical protein
MGDHETALGTYAVGRGPAAFTATHSSSLSSRALFGHFSWASTLSETESHSFPPLLYFCAKLLCFAIR